MKASPLRLISVIAAVGLALSAAPAHAAETKPDPTAPIIVKPDPSDRIIPHPRPPRIPCQKPIPPPGWEVPMYCQIGPIIPSPRPPWEIVDPIPGPVLPWSPELTANPILPVNPGKQLDPADPKHYTGTYQPQV